MVPNQVKSALPIWVQNPFLALWRAPVSSAVIQAALVRPARRKRRGRPRKPPPHTRLGNGLGRFGRLGAPESGGRWALIQAFAAAGPLSQTSCGALAKTSS